MHKSCYCCEDVHDKSFEDFIKSPFQTNFSRAAAGFEIIQAERLIDADGQIEWFMDLAAKWKLPMITDQQFAPVLKEARFWRTENEEGYYTAENRIARSMYLNPALLPSDAEARISCRLKNTYFDAFVEDMMGYRKLECEGKVKESTKESQQEESVSAASG